MPRKRKANSEQDTARFAHITRDYRPLSYDQVAVLLRFCSQIKRPKAKTQTQGNVPLSCGIKILIPFSPYVMYTRIPTMKRGLVPIHSNTLTLPAQLAIRGRRDRAGSLTLRGGALLEREQLLGAEAFVVDLAGRFDHVLQVGAGEEVAQVDEFAVAFVFYVNGAPVNNMLVGCG